MCKNQISMHVIVCLSVFYGHCVCVSINVQLVIYMSTVKIVQRRLISK